MTPRWRAFLITALGGYTKEEFLHVKAEGTITVEAAHPDTVALIFAEERLQFAEANIKRLEEASVRYRSYWQYLSKRITKMTGGKKGLRINLCLNPPDGLTVIKTGVTPGHRPYRIVKDSRGFVYVQVKTGTAHVYTKLPGGTKIYNDLNMGNIHYTKKPRYGPEIVKHGPTRPRRIVGKEPFWHWAHAWSQPKLSWEQQNIIRQLEESNV